MPRPLAANWEAMKAAFTQGVPLRDIAQKFDINYHALRARAQRHKWRDDAAAGAAVMHQVAATTMAERGTQWGSRMAALVERQLKHLESLDPSKLKLSEIETLTRIIDGTDKTARRTFGLDNDAARRSVNINVATGIAIAPTVQWRGIPLRESDDEVIDVTVMNVEEPTGT